MKKSLKTFKNQMVTGFKIFGKTLIQDSIQNNIYYEEEFIYILVSLIYIRGYSFFLFYIEY